MCFDLQVPTPASYGKYNILSGSRNDLVTTTPTFTDAERKERKQKQSRFDRAKSKIISNNVNFDIMTSALRRLVNYTTALL